ncbi:AAA family ATPase [Paenibacillus flagellatus]|nr:AAA family ATPase [Paenibacillus flagellatus]
MNVRDIRIDAFGALKDRRFAPEGPATLFYGPNEAGKSTLMGFIRAVLFGLPRSPAFERHEPPSGGPYGGSLVIELPDGTSYRVERTFYGESASGRGKHGMGRVRLTRLDAGADGNVAASASGGAGDEALLKALLGGVQGELFRSVFAFGLGELQELGTLQSEEVAGFLYSAGWGAGGAAIAAAEKRLAQEMDRLYRPRGKNQDIPQLVKRWEDELGGLRRSKDDLSRYAAMKDELERLDRDILEADEAMRRDRESSQRVDRWRRAREHGLRRREVVRQLSGLPAFDRFPEEALARFEARSADRERWTEELREREEKLAAIERSLDGIRVDEPALDARPKLEALLERAGLYREAKAAAARESAEADAAEREAAQTAARLGGGWTAAELAAYPLPVSDRERVREAKARLAALAREAELARAEDERAAGELAAAKRRAALAREALAAAEADAPPDWEPSAEAMRRKLALRPPAPEAASASPPRCRPQPPSSCPRCSGCATTPCWRR